MLLPQHRIQLLLRLPVGRGQRNGGGGGGGGDGGGGGGGGGHGFLAVMMLYFFVGPSRDGHGGGVNLIVDGDKIVGFDFGGFELGLVEDRRPHLLTSVLVVDALEARPTGSDDVLHLPVRRFVQQHRHLVDFVINDVHSRRRRHFSVSI